MSAQPLEQSEPAGAVNRGVRDVGRVTAEHEHLGRLLSATIDAAGSVRFPGLVNRLTECLDQHYFDVRRHVAATSAAGEWVQSSLRHLNAATFDIQVGRDLEGVRRHLDAHIGSCPLLDEPCPTLPDRR